MGMALGLLSPIMGAVQGVMGFAGQNAAADAQADYQRRQMEANNLEASRKQAELRQKQAQEKEALSRKKLEAQRELRKGRSTATVSAAEAGVAGSSVDALLRDFSVQSSLYRESLLRQQQFTDTGTSLQIAGIEANTQGLNTRTNAPISRPSFASALFRVGGNVLGSIGSQGSLQL